MSRDDLTPKQEAYVRARMSGKSQREAYREAYPRSRKWKDSAVDVKACELEKTGKVLGRLQELTKQAADESVADRTEILHAQTFKLRKAMEQAREGNLTQSLAYAIDGSSDRLMQWVPEEEGQGASRTFDFARLIGRDFVDMHRWVAEHRYDEYVMPGGRGSLKTSTVALEIVGGVAAVKGRNAVCMRNRSNKLRVSVFAEVKKAARRHGVFDEFDFTVSPMQAVHKPTGNVIYFFGADNVAPEDSQLKGFTPEQGYIAYLWFEEASQFPGYAYLRSMRQTVLRGSDLPTWTFITYNPPISVNSWVNKEEHVPQEGRVVVRSHYLNAPREWLGAAFLATAEALKKRNPRAYRHEYDGEAVGTGANVFDPSVIEVRAISPEEREALHDVSHGVDAGFTHPWVHERVAYDSNEHILYVLDEDVMRGANDAKTCERLKASLKRTNEPGADLWCDSAAPSMINYYQEQGLNALQCMKQGLNSPTERVRWFNRLTKIVIDPETAPLAAEQFPSMEYVTTRQGDITETLPKIDDDAVDAVGYACGLWIRQGL